MTELKSSLGERQCLQPVGVILIAFIEVRRHAHRGWHYSLASILTVQMEEEKGVEACTHHPISSLTPCHGMSCFKLPLPWSPCRNGAHPRTVNKNKLLLPDAALVRMVYQSVTKETKAVGMLDSLPDHFCSRKRSFNHHGQGQKETTREQRQNIPRETP